MLELGKLIKGWTYEQYASACKEHRALRASMAREGMRSMAHLKVFMDTPTEPTPAMRLGILLHSAVENPARFKERFVVKPKFTGLTKDGRESERSAEAKEKYEHWRATLPGGTIVVNQDEADRLGGMLNAVNNHRIAKAMLRDSVQEGSLIVKDPETGLIMGCRPDLVASRGHLGDLKTTRSAYPEEFVQEIFSRRGLFYVLSAAHYVHVAKIAGLSTGDTYTFIAVENEPPFGVNVFPLDSGMLSVGEQVRARVAREYAECLATGKWPGYEEKFVQIEIPQYVKYEEVPNEVA